MNKDRWAALLCALCAFLALCFWQSIPGAGRDAEPGRERCGACAPCRCCAEERESAAAPRAAEGRPFRREEQPRDPAICRAPRPEREK